MVARMPEKKPGMDIVRFYVDENLKRSFKRACEIRSTTMTDEIVSFIERYVEETKPLMEMIDSQLKKQTENS